MTERYRQLDGLRGVAALVVVLNHYAQIPPESIRLALRATDMVHWQTWLSPWAWLRFTPLRLLVNGQAAVILFFVLSGFVLALPSAGQASYRAFLGKRIVRVYFPFVVATLVSAAAWALLPTGATPAASDWANRLRAIPSDFSVVDHLVMTGAHEAIVLNPVMWTLIHEMRVSLALPLLYLAIRHGTIRTVVACILLSAVASIGLNDSVSGSWQASIHYLWMFAAGGALALHRDTVRGWVKRRNASFRVAAWAVALALLSAFGHMWFDFLIGLGALSIIALLLSGSGPAKLLQSPVAAWLGRVSYSLYLIHLPILILAVMAGLPLGWLPVVFGLTLVGAETAYQCVERPFQRLGRRLALPTMAVAPVGKG